MDNASDVVESMHADLERLADEASASSMRALRAALVEAVGGLRGSGLWTAAASETALLQIRAALRMAVSARSGPEYRRRAQETARAAARRQRDLLRVLDRRFLGAVRPLNFDVLTWADRQGDRLGKLRLKTFQRSFARYGAEVVDDIEGTVLANALIGRPWHKARSMLSRSAVAAAGDQAWRIDRIMRTETSAVYNGALLASLEEEDDPEDPMLKRLSATFDNRTGLDSVAVHNQLRPVWRPFEDTRGRLYQAPPNRPHDREIVLPHRAAWGPTPPSLGGATPKSAGRRGDRGESAATREAAGRLALLSGEVDDLRRRQAAGIESGGLMKSARAKLREGQVVLAMRRASDAVAAGRGVVAAVGRRVTFGGIAGRVAEIRGESAVVVLGGARVSVPIIDGKILGSTAGAGTVTMPPELSGQAAAMLVSAMPRR